MGISIFVGTSYEKDSLLNLSRLVNEGEKYGIPVMAVTAVGRELDKRDARYLALASRIAAELGARIVKTYWCENFDKVVKGCPVPVVMAGGPKTETELQVFQFVHDGMQKGAIGVNLGRNVWQNDHPGGHDQGHPRHRPRRRHAGEGPKNLRRGKKQMKPVSSPLVGED